MSKIIQKNRKTWKHVGIQPEEASKMESTENKGESFCACPRCKCQVDLEQGEGVSANDEVYCSEACARAHDKGMRCPDPDCECHVTA